MNAAARRISLVVFTASMVAIPHPAWTESANGVSPGFVDRVAEIGSRCPTFSWQEVAEAAGYELVAFALNDGVEPAAVTSTELVPEAEVLCVRVPGGATSWTPALEQCLAPGGAYVWFLRGIFEDEAGEEFPGDWSDGRFFAVSGVPSPEEVNEALRVLRRHLGDDPAFNEDDEAAAARGVARRARGAAGGTSKVPKAVPIAPTAIRGHMTEPAGEFYGVVGVVSSPEGAGLAAANLAGGADLVLDGSSTGEANTFLTQSSLNRPSDGDELFALFNPGPGTLSLEVEGVVFGNGSGLADVNAAALGGLGPAGWANKEELATAGAVPVHWDNLTDVPPDLADGDQDTTYTAGPGLALEGGELSTVWPGTTWGRHLSTTLDSDGTFAFNASTVVVGSDGLGLISYYHSTNADLKVAHCSDVACTSATTATIDSAGDVGWGNSTTVGSDGLGLISYYDLTKYDLKVAHCNDILCSGATTSTIDSAGDVGRFISITVGPDGLGLISYYAGTTEDLRVAHCSNIVCSSASITTIDSGGDVGAFPSIAVGSDRLGLISYRDWTNGDLKVAHCDDILCTGATTSTIDSAGDVGYDTSITVGSDGLGLISYYDGTSNDLKVAHCNDVLCSSATTTNIDTSGDVGSQTSITVGSDGLGVISYFRFDMGNLKVAHCSNITCSQASSIGVDSAGVLGGWGSVTVGPDGLPLMSYYDATNQEFNVMHCSNRFCIPHVRYR